jgi:hypothetical protein
MLDISGYKGNDNQNHIKILPHSCQSDCCQEHQQQQMLARLWGEKKPHTLLVVMQILETL